MLSQSEANERTLTRVRPREGKAMWSWRESNPRPNRETIRFLHAYSSLWFSNADKTWTTNRHLSS